MTATACARRAGSPWSERPAVRDGRKLVPLLLVREGSHRRRVRRDRSSAAEASTCGGGVALLQQALSSSAGPTGPADRPALHPWPRGHLGAGATSLAMRGQENRRGASGARLSHPSVEAAV